MLCFVFGLGLGVNQWRSEPFTARGTCESRDAEVPL
jgi:hypothetical protein